MMTNQMKPIQYRRSEQGSILAWVAMFLLLAFLPLLGLVMDGTILYLVRNKAQTAIDAACEHAAWEAIDREAYQITGQIVYRSNHDISLAANTTFTQGMSGKPLVLMAWQPVQTMIDTANHRVVCQANVAALNLFILAPTPIRSFAASAIRFR
jgi:Flp pilus assembly protein TadG